MWPQRIVPVDVKGFLQPSPVAHYLWMPNFGKVFPSFHLSVLVPSEVSSSIVDELRSLFSSVVVLIATYSSSRLKAL